MTAILTRHFLLQYEELITDFKASVLPDGYDPDPKKTPKQKTPKMSRKRPRVRALCIHRLSFLLTCVVQEDDDEAGPSPKRQKRDGGAAAERDWQQLVASGDVGSVM